MPLDGGVEAWKGIFQSVRVVSGGKLTINVDVATAVFWQVGDVVRIAQQLMRCSKCPHLLCILLPIAFLTFLSTSHSRC